MFVCLCAGITDQQINDYLEVHLKDKANLSSLDDNCLNNLNALFDQRVDQAEDKSMLIADLAEKRQNHCQIEMSEGDCRLKTKECFEQMRCELGVAMRCKRCTECIEQLIVQYQLKKQKV